MNSLLHLCLFSYFACVCESVFDHVVVVVVVNLSFLPLSPPRGPQGASLHHYSVHFTHTNMVGVVFRFRMKNV